jgi:CheY-like chemotaxis protein
MPTMMAASPAPPWNAPRCNDLWPISPRADRCGRGLQGRSPHALAGGFRQDGRGLRCPRRLVRRCDPAVQYHHSVHIRRSSVAARPDRLGTNSDTTTRLKRPRRPQRLAQTRNCASFLLYSNSGESSLVDEDSSFLLRFLVRTRPVSGPGIASLIRSASTQRSRFTMATRNNISKREILIVDDNPHVLQAMSDLLKRQGLPVLTARNGWDALVKMKKDDNICLVLLDLWMPLMDGWEFLHQQKSDPTIADIPVVVLSAIPPASLDGAEIVLRKPVDPGLLMATVRHYFEM